MRAKVVVFPIRGRNWCFSRSIDPSTAAAQSSTAPSTVKELWNKISSNKPSEDSKVELAVDFFANKVILISFLLLLHNAWIVFVFVSFWFVRCVKMFCGKFSASWRHLEFVLFGNELFTLMYTYLSGYTLAIASCCVVHCTFGVYRACMRGLLVSNVWRYV